MQVFVRDNDMNGALRILKKEMQREGIFREMKRRRAYEKPSERRAREKAEAVRRYRKAMRKRMERQGYWLIGGRDEGWSRVIAGALTKPKGFTLK